MYIKLLIIFILLNNQNIKLIIYEYKVYLSPLRGTKNFRFIKIKQTKISIYRIKIFWILHGFYPLPSSSSSAASFLCSLLLSSHAWANYNRLTTTVWHPNTFIFNFLANKCKSFIDVLASFSGSLKKLHLMLCC